jgi:putative endonuclease
MRFIHYYGIMGERYYYVYMLTNYTNTTIYTGVTNDLYARVLAHRSGTRGVFSRKYKLRKLVYYEVYGDINDAIAREKRIKGGSRKRKVKLIEADNPGWQDLMPDESG